MYHLINVCDVRWFLLIANERAWINKLRRWLVYVFVEIESWNKNNKNNEKKKRNARASTQCTLANQKGLINRNDFLNCLCLESNKHVQTHKYQLLAFHTEPLNNVLTASRITTKSKRIFRAAGIIKTLANSSGGCHKERANNIRSQLITSKK